MTKILLDVHLHYLQWRHGLSATMQQSCDLRAYSEFLIDKANLQHRESTATVSPLWRCIIIIIIIGIHWKQCMRPVQVVDISLSKNAKTFPLVQSGGPIMGQFLCGSKKGLSCRDSIFAQSSHFPYFLWTFGSTTQASVGLWQHLLCEINSNNLKYKRQKSLLAVRLIISWKETKLYILCTTQFTNAAKRLLLFWVVWFRVVSLSWIWPLPAVTQ